MQPRKGGERSINSTGPVKIAEDQELQDGLRIKEVNDELFDHLIGALRWILHYVKRHNMSMPEQDKLIRLIERAEEIEDKLPSSVSDDC
jgi:hypothetical protein